MGVFGAGVFNLTGAGVVTVGASGAGTVDLALASVSTGTLNLGTGGLAGTLNAANVFNDSGLQS